MKIYAIMLLDQDRTKGDIFTLHTDLEHSKYIARMCFENREENQIVELHEWEGASYPPQVIDFKE